MVAAELAATSPERVEPLVLIAPIGLWRDDHPVPDISGVPRGYDPCSDPRRPGRPAGGDAPGARPDDPEPLLLAAVTMASILQFIWPLPDKGLRKRLYRVKAPTLLVWGAQDRLVHPAYGDDFVAAIADARLEVIDGAGHLPQLEQPERTIDVVTRRSTRPVTSLSGLEVGGEMSLRGPAAQNLGSQRSSDAGPRRDPDHVERAPGRSQW